MSAGTWLTVLRRYLALLAISNAAWEFAHLPLYTVWWTEGLSKSALAALHCTGGDLIIAMASLLLSLIFVGTPRWPAHGFIPVAAGTLVIGVAYTVFSEWLNVYVRASWAYSGLMPVITVFGVRLGISPLLQWSVLPALSFAFVFFWGRKIPEAPGRPDAGKV